MFFSGGGWSSSSTSSSSSGLGCGRDCQRQFSVDVFFWGGGPVPVRVPVPAGYTMPNADIDIPIQSMYDRSSVCQHVCLFRLFRGRICDSDVTVMFVLRVVWNGEKHCQSQWDSLAASVYNSLAAARTFCAFPGLGLDTSRPRKATPWLGVPNITPRVVRKGNKWRLVSATSSNLGGEFQCVGGHR